MECVMNRHVRAVHYNRTFHYFHRKHVIEVMLGGGYVKVISGGYVSRSYQEEDVWDTFWK